MAKTQILIVEDEGIIAEDLKRSLQDLGYSVCEVVASGEDALEKAEECNPDLVIMDIVLQGEMDGIEATKQIRSRFNIPIVYLTAYADVKTLERAKITDPFGYIIKPFEDRELHVAVEMALHKHELEMRLKESEEWLSTTLRSIGDAVIATDTGGYVTFINPVAQSLTGWKEKDAVGKPLQDVFNIINEFRRAPVENPVTRVIREGVVVGLANHTLLIAKDGTETPIADSAAPIKDNGGDIIGVVLVFRDVTERKKAEEALRESEEKFSTLFHKSNDGIFIHDLEGNIIDVNQKVLDLFGYTRSEILSRKILDLHPIDALETSKAAFEKISKDGFVNFEIEFRKKDGEVFPAEVSSSIFKIGGMKVIQGIVRDITERKQAEGALRESEEKYRTLIESSSDCICHLDLDGKIRYMNPGGVKLNELKSSEDACGRDCAFAVKEEYIDLMEDALEKARHGEVVNLEYESTTAKGKDKWWESIIGPIKDDKSNVVSLIRISRDVTDRKSLEVELKNHVKKVELSNKLKDIFTDILRHDLLNPVGIIQNAVELAMERDLQPDENKELEIISRNVKKLHIMIDDATKYAKLESIDELDFNKADVNEIVRKAVKRVENLAKEKDTEIVNKMDGEHFALVNPFIEDVFINILSNALKYSPEKSKVIVEIESNKKDWRIMFEDFGEGIPEEYKENIFRRFERVKDSGVKGIGLGLAIAKRIVKLHNGKIWVEDNPDGGSIFYVSLPKA